MPGNRTDPSFAKRNGVKRKTPPAPQEQAGSTERHLGRIEAAWPEKSKAGVDREAVRGAVQVHGDEDNEASAPRFRLFSQDDAGLTQLVEYHPSKVAVDGSSPLARSKSSLMRPK